MAWGSLSATNRAKRAGAWGTAGERRRSLLEGVLTGWSDGMKPTQFPWKWLLLGLLAVLLSSTALFPFLVGDTSRFSDLIATELSRWTEGQVKFVGPVRVSFFPDVSVRGELRVWDSERLPQVQSIDVQKAKISLDLVDLLRGGVAIDSLRLLKPRITLRDGTLPVSPQAAGIEMSKLLANAPVRALHVRKGRIKLGRKGGMIKEVYAHLNVSEDTGAVSGFGSFAFRDTTVRYTVETGSPNMTAVTESIPVRLGLDSKLVRAKISGNASYQTEFKLDGKLEAEIDDLRKFLRWTGIRVPDGESLKTFTAAGAFHLDGPNLTFDDGTFTIDGNKAIGLLAVTTTPARPRFEGTLAFGRLVLDPYLGKSTPQTETGSPAKASLLDGALARYFDADLRISAAEIEAGALKLGRGGFTISAKDGIISGEIGELELCGGSADGRVSVDLEEATTPMDVVANLTDFSLDSCLESFRVNLPVKGTSSVKAELSTAGETLADFLHTVTGTLVLAVRDGSVPVDLSHLLAATTPLEENGWSGDNGSQFSQLDANCRVIAGVIRCASVTMQTAQGTVSGGGTVDLSSQTLDWNLSVTDDIDGAKTSQLTEQDKTKVSIRGALLEPTIRRADRPTLGESALPSPSTGQQALPH
jgi:AsmA protein